MSTFKEVLGLFHKSEFWDLYWGKAPYFCEGNASEARQLFTRADLLALLGRDGVPNDHLVILNEGEELARSAYTSGAHLETGSSIRPDKVVELLAKQGMSLLIKSAHRWHEGLSALQRALVHSVGMPVSINLYHSPPGASSLPPHYDRHDVLILQLKGSKRWTLLGDGMTIGMPDSPSSDLPPPKEVMLDLQLDPGNLLYLPAGLWHQARSYESAALHAAIGLRPLTARDLLQAVCNKLARNPAMSHRIRSVGVVPDAANIETVTSVLIKEFMQILGPGAAAALLAEMIAEIQLIGPSSWPDL